jgi:hypothetical protein
MGSSQMGYECDSSVIPALAIRILIGPNLETACEMPDEIDDSEAMSPVRVWRFGWEGRVIGLRS